MRTPALRVLLLALCALLGTGGCGGFHNGPLGTATIIGRVVGADASLAKVTLKLSEHEDVDGGSGEAPEEDTFTVRVEPGGHFELVDVPTLPGVLYVTATATQAARVAVAPTGGRVLDVGDVVPRPGAFLDVQVLDAAGQPLPRALLEVHELGVEDVAVDAQGRARLGPLPAGCYEVRATADGVGEAREERCVAEGEALGLVLRVPGDSSEG